MDLQQSDFDRLLFFEHARKTAEATYTKDPLDAEVCLSFFAFSIPNFLSFFHIYIELTHAFNAPLIPEMFMAIEEFWNFFVAFVS